MTLGAFKGRLTPFNQPEILKFFRESGKTGLLQITSADMTKGLYVRRGRVVAAESNDPGESLLSLVAAAVPLGADQVAACESLIAAGSRPGRALIQVGALTPAGLCEWTERRVRAVIRSVLAWDEGNFAFDEGPMPPPDWLTVDLDIVDLLLRNLRDVEGRDLLASRLPEPDVVFEHITFSEGGEPPPLLPHERYVLGLVNGRRTAAEIGRFSELGDDATRSILALLSLVGCTRQGRSDPVDTGPIPAEPPGADSRVMIRAYNEMFAFLYAYMIKEVGPIAEHVLEKYLREVRESNATLFNKVALGKDGTLAEEALGRNLQLLRGKSRHEMLVGGLNELLYSELLAVKRTLGADHEEIVVRRLKELRKSPTVG
ncbi:MAG: DUF4388 domain-containing protein [Acidobacteria bacterium]|nr:DUF4388 domain-containing protein [Acidobacteriota bacterium]